MAEFNNTLVAFTDISGFKAMMNTENEAFAAMREFYSKGFSILKYQLFPQVRGFFVSDCGILAVDQGNASDQIKNLLEIIKILNLQMLESDIVLKSSIAYGEFSYKRLTEHFNIEKMPIYGQGYLNAYINAEVSKPKLKPGECRIAINSLEDIYFSKFEQLELCDLRNFTIMDDDAKEKKTYEYLYYYWMVEDKSKISDFQTDYDAIYEIENKNLKYRKIKDLLINYTDTFRNPTLDNYKRSKKVKFA